MEEKLENGFAYSGNSEPIVISKEEYMLNKRRSDTVVKSNDLIEASYKLSLNEQRLIIYMASKINKDDTEFRTVRVSVKEFADTFELEYRNIYKEIKKISKSLTSKSISVKSDKSSKNSDYLFISWLSSAEYINGVLELEFSAKMRPYLLELKNNFSKYKLGDFVKFTSTYSIRLYQLLRRYEDFRDGTKYYTIDEFRRIFSLEDKYPKYSNLKRRVISTAINEINEVSDITIDIFEDKEGKKVRGIQFKVTMKKEAKEQKEEGPKVDPNLIITVKTLLQTCMSEIVKDKDAIALLEAAQNDVAKIMQKIMLVQQSKTKIENVPGFLINSIRNDYQVISMPVKTPKSDYIEHQEQDDFEELAQMSRNR